MPQKILYIGTGTHLDPIIDFSETDEFIFVDSLPRNAHGFDYYSKFYYQKYFLEQLELKLKDLDLFVKSKKTLTENFQEINVSNIESECLAVESKTNKKFNLKYYTSTAIPNDLYDNFELQNEIETCDTLLICGHHPDKKIIKYLKKPFNVIGYSSTYFPKYIDKLDKESEIINWILTNPHSIKSYIVVDRETGKKYYCTNYQEFYYKLENIKNKFSYC